MSDFATVTSRGLRVQVKRSGWGATNNGVSSKFDVLTVVGVKLRGRAVACSSLPTDCQIDVPTKEAPAVTIEVFERGRYDGVHLALVPLEMQAGWWVTPQSSGCLGPMNGGNAASSDARPWRRIVEALGGDSITVNIHDRFETVAQHNALSA